MLRKNKLHTASQAKLHRLSYHFITKVTPAHDIVQERPSTAPGRLPDSSHFLASDLEDMAYSTSDGPSMYYYAMRRKTPEMTTSVETLRRLILPHLHELAEEYSAVLLYRGTSFNSASPIYLIHMDSGSITRFKEWLSELETSVLPCPVQVVPGVLDRAMRDLLVDVERQPQIGASLGTDLRSASGTLGCYLRDINTKKIYALTNAHVVQDAINVFVPSQTDWEKRCGYLTSRISERQDYLQQMRYVGISTARITAQEVLLKKLMSELRTLQEADLSFGMVESIRWEYVLCPDQMDAAIDLHDYWDHALIRVNDTRVNDSTCKNDLLLNIDHEGLPMNRTGTIAIGTSVWKSGKSTGVTSGVINAYRTDLKFRTAINGIYHDKRIRAWTVVSGKERPFSSLGDSGSAVYGFEHLYGLVFGGTSHEQYNSHDVSYMLDINDILSHLSACGYQLELA